MMFFARCLVIVNAKSRPGLIALARYLEKQFNDRDGCENGCIYMPDQINGQLWPHVFMRSLAGNLRRMGSEFPPTKRGRRGPYNRCGHEAPAPIGEKTKPAATGPLTPDGSNDSDRDAGLRSSVFPNGRGRPQLAALFVPSVLAALALKH